MTKHVQLRHTAGCERVDGMADCAALNMERRIMYPRLTLSAFIVALAILPAACAPQPTEMAAPAPASSLSGPASTAPMASPMPGMAGMDHSNMPGMRMQGMDHSNMPSMQGMDMNTMMSHCAQMRQQTTSGQTAQGRQMLDQCDQMDRSMGMTPPPRR
jgi:uncharacterized protein involved in copper resistance